MRDSSSGTTPCASGRVVWRWEWNSFPQYRKFSGPLTASFGSQRSPTTWQLSSASAVRQLSARLNLFYSKNLKISSKSSTQAPTLYVFISVSFFHSKAPDQQLQSPITWGCFLLSVQEQTHCKQWNTAWQSMDPSVGTGMHQELRKNLLLVLTLQDDERAKYHQHFS